MSGNEKIEQFVNSANKSALSLEGATGAWTGRDYRESLRDGRSVWYDGEEIDVCSHPRFTGVLETLQSLYDTQYLEANLDTTTYVSELTGNRVSYSYLAPTTREELTTKWKNSHFWMSESLGLMPRLPDFMSNVVVGLYDYKAHAGSVDPLYEKNIERYFEYCREHDVSITHAIGDPQIDRSGSLEDNPEFALRVVEIQAEGIVVNGAKQLATLAPYCHEALIYLSPSFAKRKDPSYVGWFAAPMATKGLKILCRESHCKDSGGHEHRLSNHYDEQDAMLFFDNVFIPMERVFLLNDADTAFKGFFRLNAWALYIGQIRFYHRLKTFLGITSLVSKAIGVNEFREIQNNLGELAVYAEMVRLGLVGMDAEAKPTDSGLMAPSSTFAMDSFAAQIASRISEILRVISGSGIVMHPSRKDLENPELRPYLDLYMRGKGCDAEYKSRLFKLAWELIADAFGSRQEIYELWNRGDVVRNRIHVYQSSPDRVEMEERLTRWINSF